MASRALIFQKAGQALNTLALLTPFLGESAPLVTKVSQFLSKLLAGATVGFQAYDTIVAELDELIGEMDVIRERGGVTSDDFLAEIAAIDERGARLDATLLRLKG